MIRATLKTIPYLFSLLVLWFLFLTLKHIAENKQEKQQGWSYIEDELPSKY